MKAEVKPHNGTPTLFLNGEASFYSCQWMSSSPAQEEFPAEGCVRAFGKAGVHIYATGPEVFKQSRAEMECGVKCPGIRRLIQNPSTVNP